MNKLKRILFTFAATIGLAMPAIAPVAVHAQVDFDDGLCKGANLDLSADCTANQGSGTEVASVIALAINLFSIVVGLIAVVMIIVGGVKYITSGGDSGNITGAKNTILYAVIGLVIVALAQVIVRFVLQAVETGTTPS